MPIPRRPVILALVTAVACTPARFGWDEATNGDLETYRARFEAAAGDHFDRQWAHPELLEAAKKARVLWLGDFHPSLRLHRLHTALLTELQRDGRPLLLALEAIGDQDETWVAEYLAGSLSLTALAERMRARWAGSWLDDPDLDPWYYRWLLTFARAHAVPVAGLEPTPRPPLATRDPLISARVTELVERHPRHLVVVVLGQAHLLGIGGQLARCQVPQLALGGVPPRGLLAAAPSTPCPGSVHRSPGGLWWFDELLGVGR